MIHLPCVIRGQAKKVILRENQSIIFKKDINYCQFIGTFTHDQSLHTLWYSLRSLSEKPSARLRAYLLHRWLSTHLSYSYNVLLCWIILYSCMSRHGKPYVRSDARRLEHIYNYEKYMYQLELTVRLLRHTMRAQLKRGISKLKSANAIGAVLGKGKTVKWRTKIWRKSISCWRNASRH